MVLKRFYTRRYTGRDSPSVDDEAAADTAAASNITSKCDPHDRVLVIKEAVVNLHESRASTREAALASIIDALEGFVPALFVDGASYPDDVLRRCCVSIKRGAAKETTLALRAVALLAVTVRGGVGAKKIMSETCPLVSRIIRESTDASLLIAALECLAVVAFVDVAADNMDDTEACLKALWGLICPATAPKLAAGVARATSPRVLDAAVLAWTLVLTTTGGWKSAPRGWRERDTAAHLAGLLYSDCRAVRIAAGEALAVSMEMKLFTRDKNDVLFSRMEERAADLAIEAAGAGVVKDGFLEQKDLFRKINSFLADGKPPESSVRTSSSHHGFLTTSTWTDMIRLNFLRRFLGGGFLNHIQGKGLLRQVFIVKDSEIAGKLSAARSKQSLKKDTRIVEELNGGISMEVKEKKQEMKKKSQEKQRGLKKDRQTSCELKNGSDL
uniref:Interferon-related developmental regulator N-terminal domain-containing protein n=1 Tax=Leersia perrieri TaxID=77586 RepID=A0A0D9WIV3_9ORYZ